jgi:two-component system OmpR family response regulator
MDSQGHILVVDDDAEIRSLVAEYLSSHGYRVSVARDGVQMRAALKADRPDLVVLDLMLPGEDGLSLCRDLRARSNLPVIMLTAKAQERDIVRALDAGANDYIVKPFQPRELMARVRRLAKASP